MTISKVIQEFNNIKSQNLKDNPTKFLDLLSTNDKDQRSTLTVCTENKELVSLVSVKCQIWSIKVLGVSNTEKDHKDE